MERNRHPIIMNFAKYAYTPPATNQASPGMPGALPPEAAAGSSMGAPGGNGGIPPELLQIMAGAPPTEAGVPASAPTQDMSTAPAGASPDMAAAPPPDTVPEENVTYDEAAQVSPDVVSDHLTQLQSALAVLQEGIKQLRRVVDSITNAQTNAGASSLEEPKAAHYKGIRPDINSLFKALKDLS